MNYVSDIITYIRRIVKTPSNAALTDNLIIDYINRFIMMDVQARIQLFDFKTTYGFNTQPGVDTYNMPLYSVQTEPGSQEVAMYPVYQGFFGPAYVNGIQVPFYTQLEAWTNLWPEYLQSLQPAAMGNGGDTYSFYLPFFPAVPGHIDISGIMATNTNQDPPVNNTLLVNPNSPYNGNSVIPTTSVQPGVIITTQDATGANVVVYDSGQFLTGNVGYGLLMSPGNAPFGIAPLSGGYSTTSNTVNYASGLVNVTFPTTIPANTPINVSCYFYQPGLPRAIFYYNNSITLRNPPNVQYYVEMSAYLTPAAFFSTAQAVPFGYMCEYIARGAARKILSDTGDIEQFMFYEPLFKEQETLVWKRSQRIFTSNRTGTIFSENQGPANNFGQGASY
jgi:hypothetical protein